VARNHPKPNGFGCEFEIALVGAIASRFRQTSWLRWQASFSPPDPFAIPIPIHDLSINRRQAEPCYSSMTMLYGSQMGNKVVGLLYIVDRLGKQQETLVHRSFSRSIAVNPRWHSCNVKSMGCLASPGDQLHELLYNFTT
jgi:hypothetical protein